MRELVFHYCALCAQKGIAFYADYPKVYYHIVQYHNAEPLPNMGRTDDITFFDGMAPFYQKKERKVDITIPEAKKIIDECAVLRPRKKEIGNYGAKKIMPLKVKSSLLAKLDRYAMNNTGGSRSEAVRTAICRFLENPSINDDLGEGKSYVVTITISEIGYSLLSSIAEQTGISVSGLIRSAINAIPLR